MNFGQNLYNWFLSNAQSLVLMAVGVVLYIGELKYRKGTQINTERCQL